MIVRTSPTDWTGPAQSPEDSPVDPCAKPGRHVSFHAVGARGVLFDSITQKLYLLNRLGGFIWCCLAEGMSHAEVAKELVHRSSTDLETAAASVQSAVTKWHALGLMSDARPTDEIIAAPAGMAIKHAAPAALESRPADSRIRICRVLGNDFAVQFWDGELEAEALHLLQAHLVEMSLGVTATLDVARGEGGSIALRHDTETMQVLHDPRSLAPAVFASLMKLALMYSRSYPALHAAAVRTKNGAALFPGISGCGKSTLMSGLLAAGYDVLADDTVVFEREAMRFRPLTPYLCVKEGSWETLGGRFPDLMARRDFHRADGAHVRYIEAPGYSARGDQDRGHSVRVIVYPRYQAASSVRLTRIAGFMALKELLPSIDPIGHKFTAEDIDRFIGWMAGIECYTFVYPSLDAAVETLRGVLE